MYLEHFYRLLVIITETKSSKTEQKVRNSNNFVNETKVGKNQM